MVRTDNRPSRSPIKGLVLALAVMIAGHPVFAAGIDSRAYTCGGLRSLIATHGYVFISQATFGDFVVANPSYCAGGHIVEPRSVATSDNPECVVNYCVPRDTGSFEGGM